MFYSKSTLGFYDPEDLMPGDVVKVDERDYQTLLQLGYPIVPNEQGYPVSVLPAPPTLEQKVAEFADLIQSHLDEKAREFGYDDIKAAVTYADEPAVPKFQNEGLALRAWRSKVWAFGYSLLAEVQAGVRAEPTSEEMLAALPVFVLE